MENKTDIFIKVNKEDIVFITTIIESFEGIAAVRTPNPEHGTRKSVLHCIVSPDYMEQFKVIVADLSKEYTIERVASNEAS